MDSSTTRQRKNAGEINQSAEQNTYSQSEEDFDQFTDGDSNSKDRSDGKVKEKKGEPKDDTPEFMKDALKDMKPRWRNWWVRIFFTLVMIAAFAAVIYFGPFAFMGLVILLQMKSFHEIISITYQVYKSYKLPWVRTLCWYFLFCANYFFYGEIVAERFASLIRSEEILTFFAHYHRMISLALYLVGFIMFVLSLVKYHYRLQFYMFAWTHMVLLLIVTQSHLLIQNLLEGLIWLVVPAMMVVCNDCFAYICGFFFGKTPLIKLSPKKTWEGFIGGALFTIIFGWVIAGFLAQFSYLTCPSEVKPNLSVNLDCDPSSIFQSQTYTVPLFIKVLFKPLLIDLTTVEMLPFQLHCLAISIFASSIAPFGGFFASGFKRAFKIKDFSDTIPGHGGVVDRFDCQILMATFVNVYLSTFIRLPSPNKLFQSITMMSTADQISLFTDLHQHLASQGLIP